MGSTRYHRLPHRDPSSGGDLHVTELTCAESGVTIRGQFEIPRFAKLSDEQAQFLETFLRCRGMLNSVERELGISYPTVKARLEDLVGALDLGPVRVDTPKREKAADRKRRILEQLESGEISAAEAKIQLGVN